MEAIAKHDVRTMKRVCDSCEITYNNRLDLERHMMIAHGVSTSDQNQTMVISPQITNENYLPKPIANQQTMHVLQKEKKFPTWLER